MKAPFNSLVLGVVLIAASVSGSCVAERVARPLAGAGDRSSANVVQAAQESNESVSDGLAMLRYRFDLEDRCTNQTAIDRDVAPPTVFFPIGKADMLYRVYAGGNSLPEDDRNYVPRWYLECTRNVAGKSVLDWRVKLVRRKKGDKMPSGTLATYLAKASNPYIPYGLAVGPNAPAKARVAVSRNVPGYAAYCTVSAMLTVICYVVKESGDTTPSVESEGSTLYLDDNGFLVTDAERDLLAKNSKVRDPKRGDESRKRGAGR